MSKLKPVVFIKGQYAYNARDDVKQLMLLKAMRITQDPKKLKEMIGVRTVAEVYRTLDKMSMRKEYHTALARYGVTFDYIVSNIKNEIDTAEKSSERLTALNMLLKSVGLDKYEDSENKTESWEDILLKMKEEKEQKDDNTVPLEEKEYEVNLPAVPESIRMAKELERKEGRSLYE